MQKNLVFHWRSLCEYISPHFLLQSIMGMVPCEELKNFLNLFSLGLRLGSGLEFVMFQPLLVLIILIPSSAVLSKQSKCSVRLLVLSERTYSQILPTHFMSLPVYSVSSSFFTLLPTHPHPLVEINAFDVILKLNILLYKIPNRVFNQSFQNISVVELYNNPEK